MAQSWPWVSQIAVKKKKKKKKRFEGVTRIPGTRSFHEFSPIDQYSIEMKRTSEDKEPSYVHNFKNQTKQNSVVLVLDYVCNLPI